MDERNTPVKPNLSYLFELAGGDTDFVKEIIETFISDTPEIIGSAVDYFEKHEFDLLKVTVHKLKSSVQVVGGAHLANLICNIERDADRQDASSKLEGMIKELNDGVQLMLTQLTAELKVLQST